MTIDPLYASASELLERFRTLEISPVDVLEAQLRRADEVGPIINAVTERMDESARSAAAESARRYREGNPLPLDGITVAVKEKHAIAGHHISEGSSGWAGTTPTKSHPIIERLLAAGAVLHMRTTQPEFCLTTFTHSTMWGVTRNPWHLGMTPGGSSGGSAAVLAAGMATIATASDIGGSTRGPAGFTGTIGYKAPYGRVPGVGPTSLDYYRGDGSLTRTVDDSLLVTNLISGTDGRDHVALPKATIGAGRDVSGMRIAYSADLDSLIVDPVQRANSRRMVDELAEAGCTVEEIRIGWSKDVIRSAVVSHFAQSISVWVEETVAGRHDELNDYTRNYLALMEEARPHTSQFAAMTSEYAMQQALASAMEGFDALICPTAAAIGFPAGDPMIDGIEIAGTVVGFTEGLLTLPFNVANRCPVLNVPSGFAANGMPTGIQIVGHPYDDDTVYSIGRELEARQGPLYESHRPSFSAAGAPLSDTDAPEHAAVL